MPNWGSILRRTVRTVYQGLGQSGWLLWWCVGRPKMSLLRDYQTEIRQGTESIIMISFFEKKKLFFSVFITYLTVWCRYWHTSQFFVCNDFFCWPYICVHLSACTDDEGDNDDGQPNMKYKWQCVYFMRCLPPPTSLIDWPIHIPRLMTYLVQLMHLLSTLSVSTHCIREC